MPLRQPLKVVKAMFVIPSMKCEESQVFLTIVLSCSKKILIFALELESKLKEHRKTEKWDGDSQDCEVILYC